MGTQPKRSGGLCVLAVLLSLAVPAVGDPMTAPEASSPPATQADWPQWRGPNRDGTAPSSPKLLDSWPTNGPPLLWTSAPIPCNEKGGVGSPIVADGKVFLYIEEPKKTGSYSLTTKQLREWGWDESITPELAAKVDEARKTVWGKKGADQEAAIKAFLDTLEPATAAKLGGAIKSNLTDSVTTRFDWVKLLKLATQRDKEFTLLKELDDHSVSGGLVKTALFKNQNTFFDTVICLDAATGQELWRKEFPDGLVPDPRWRGYCASSTPAVVDGKCFVAGSAGIFCVAVKDGAVLWRTPFKMFGGSSPLVVKNVVYQNTSEGMLALNAENGHLLWKQPEVKTYSSSVTLWPHAGTNYLLTLSWAGNDADLVCVEPETGKVLWRAGHCYGGQESSPVVIGDTAVVYYSWGMAAYTLTPKQATERWRADKGTGIAGDVSSPVIFHDHVYVCAGSEMTAKGIWCVGLATGEVKWKRLVENAGTTSPVLVDGKVISFVQRFDRGDDSPSRIVMFKASPDKFEELGHITQSGKKPWSCEMSSPAVANGKLFLRLHDAVACYDLTAK